MIITREILKKAVDAGIITESQCAKLIEFFRQQPNTTNNFGLTNVLYYLGGLMAIGAMSLFMTLGWEIFGGWGILFLSFCYAVLGLLLLHLFQKKDLAIPAGICATFVIFLTPLAIYGLEKAMGWWPQDATVFREYNFFIKWYWMYMELGTLAVGVILLIIYRYPFMVLPIALTLWYMSMDLTAVLTSGNYTFELGAQVSLYFGLIFMIIAFLVDLKFYRLADYAFWLYLFSVLTFWGGLTSLNSDNELAKFIYLCINLVMILIGTMLNRKVFTVFGGIGVCIYLGHLAYQVFKNSFMFPIILTLIGFIIISLGIFWQKHEQRITVSVRKILPLSLQNFLKDRDSLI